MLRGGHTKLFMLGFLWLANVNAGGFLLNKGQGILLHPILGRHPNDTLGPPHFRDTLKDTWAQRAQETSVAGRGMANGGCVLWQVLLSHSSPFNNTTESLSGGKPSAKQLHSNAFVLRSILPGCEVTIATTYDKTEG